MKKLIDVIESRGASLDKRTADRFFGDVLGKNRDIKNLIGFSKRVLKEISGELTSDENKTLETLVNNPQRMFDKRSKIYLKSMECEEQKYYFCEFTLMCQNMPSSIKNLLSTEIIKRNMKSLSKAKYTGVGSNFSGWGNTTTAVVYISLTDDMLVLVDFIKYVLKAIEPIKDDILNYHDNEADERGY